MSLAKARVALVEGDRAAALTHALAAWQTCRHERIATLVEALGAQLANVGTRADLAGGSEKQRAWLALAKANAPADLDPLLATMTGVRRKWTFEARLQALDGRADPRIAQALVATLEHPPIPGASGARAIVMTLEMIVAIADPRSIAALAQVAEAIGEVGGGLATRELRAQLPSAITRLGRKVRSRKAALSRADGATLDAIEHYLSAASAPAKRSAGNVDELFAAVYANPADDTARSVLADFLQERGDPRGEFIALQLARQAGAPRSKRESELLRAYAGEWLGPVQPAVLKSSVIYERGFLAKCVVNIEYVQNGERLVHCAEWATVRELEIRSWPLWEDLVSRMPVLRVLRGVNAVPDHPSVEDVTIGWMDNIDLLCAAAAPSLRRIVFGKVHLLPVAFRPFWSSPLCRQLASLAMYVDDYVAWIPEAAARHVPSIELSGWQMAWKLTFADNTVTATQTGKFALAGLSAELATILKAIPSPETWRVVVDVRVPAPPLTVLKRFASYELAKAK